MISDTCSRVNHVKRANLHIHIHILHTKQSKHVRNCTHIVNGHTQVPQTHTHTFFIVSVCPLVMSSHLIVFVNVHTSCK